MAAAKKSENVPKAMQEKFARIAAITDDFCGAYLNDEYAQLIRYAIAALCRRRPSPLDKGRDYTWACGITHALGMVNFLFDPSQDPHISAGNLYKAFGVSSSTGQAKSKQVRDILKMGQFDPDWGLSSNVSRNPLVWLLEVDGFIMDIRSAPREIQMAALDKGLIPYIPGEDGEPEVEAAFGKKDVKATLVKVGSPNTLYVLQVNLLGGPVTDDFIDEHPVICRTIEIKGRHTLADLHDAIFEAYDREEEHLYEFQVGGSRPNDPKAKRYGLKLPSDSVDEVSWLDAAKASLASLGLSQDDILGYRFDFGDDWWHQIDVIEVHDKAPKGKYPRVTERIGASPPQYAEFE